MTTEDILLLRKQMLEADSLIRLNIVRNAEIRVATLTRLEKIKTVEQMDKFFTMRPLVYKENNNHWWGFMHQKQEEKLLITYVELKRISTSKGQIYFRPPGDDFECMGFTAHFMDRFMQRLNFKNRDTAIRNFLKVLLIADFMGFKSTPVKNSKRRREIIGQFGDGVGLGEMVEKTPIFMTFVANSQLKDGQVKEVRAIQQMLSQMEPNEMREMQF
jgi:hypothetical protein